MSSAIRRGLAAAFLAAALLRCGGGQAAQQDDGWIDVLVVDKPGASHYGAPHTAAPTTVPSALIVRRVQAAAEAAGQSWQQDPALAALAAFVLAQNHKHGSAPTHEVIDFYAAHLGLMEATPHVIRIADPDPVALERSLGADLEQAAREFRYTHVGIAHAKRGGRDEVVVTLSRRGARLSPIPRQVPQGQTLKIQGRLVPPFQQARVLVATPKGGIVTRSTGEDQAIDVQLPLDKRGEHRIELVAQGEHGPTVIANFPIYVGQKPPRRLRRPRRRTASMQSAADVAQGLGTMLNQTRKERGLQVLRQHPRLAVVAKDHSLDMVRSGFIGHGSPTTGSAADRVERTGLRSGLVLENIGRGYDAWQIHRGLMRSPGHRANILNPDVTHFGIGVVERQEGKGRAFVATEVLVRMTHRIDAGDAPARLLSLINRGRKARGAKAVAADNVLQREAQKAARDFFARPKTTQQEVVEDAAARLRRFAIAFRRVGGVMAVVTRLSDAAQLEPTFDPELSAVGIGVAQGSRPDTAANAIAVVILLAWPR